MKLGATDLWIFCLLMSLSGVTARGTNSIPPSVSVYSGESAPRSADPEEDSKPEKKLEACTAVNPLTGGFYDLRALGNFDWSDTINSWAARGHDYGMNFTLGICSSPVKAGNPVKDMANETAVAGFYTDLDGNKVAVGSINTQPMFRGKKLVLEYQNGSYCGPKNQLRKSSLLTFTCDREIMQEASVSFLGVLNDCDYFFEVRTVHACPTAPKNDAGSLIWIFVVILCAAVLVFFAAGAMYNRLVRQKRGWRQVPPRPRPFSGLRKVGAVITSCFPISLIANRFRSVNLGFDDELETDRLDDNFSNYEQQNELLDALDIETDVSSIQ